MTFFPFKDITSVVAVVSLFLNYLLPFAVPFTVAVAFWLSVSASNKSNAINTAATKSLRLIITFKFFNYNE